MGAACSKSENIEEHQQGQGTKEAQLEKEMRELSFEIASENKRLQRLTAQGRTQEAGTCLAQIRRKEKKQKRLRIRIQNTRNNIDTVDNRLDDKDDIEDAIDTKNIAESIDVDYQAGLKAMDQMRAMRDQSDAFMEMNTDGDDAEIMAQIANMEAQNKAGTNGGSSSFSAGGGSADFAN
mmetsp:Transcript_3657/g.5407  ORF Transcript_3657/g.5407 Transcript_3657/m.5407 type:complete len:179 (+) Transcript_3657:44-580(+)|eukprot:CAMPEP_0117424676 /NCGR_PEP_ID=MMETSP0758-20121206/5057_1 /TAXON_ID=63605 /ORGANISM="Percolomonas cosmopolitus, Strain AE-1 (ATCC 50343)" /LENGTH=178 /DNA_ID=CAMNT_0005208617 /DNA_START=26 /DNA_END=562 /DNA_ORIENTATION=-